jgi:DNA-binding transcriptional MerR regulator
MDKKSRTASEMLNLLSQKQDTDTMTKVEMVESFGCSLNTMVKWIEISGLPTSARTYTVAELKAYLIPAKELLETGMNYEEVKQAIEDRNPRSAQKEGGSAEMFDLLIHKAVIAITEGRLEHELLNMPANIMEALVNLLTPKEVEKITAKISEISRSNAPLLSSRTIKLIASAQEEDKADQ